MQRRRGAGDGGFVVQLRALHDSHEPVAARQDGVLLRVQHHGREPGVGYDVVRGEEVGVDAIHVLVAHVLARGPDSVAVHAHVLDGLGEVGGELKKLLAFLVHAAHRRAGRDEDLVLLALPRAERQGRDRVRARRRLEHQTPSVLALTHAQGLHDPVRVAQHDLVLPLALAQGKHLHRAPLRLRGLRDVRAVERQHGHRGASSGRSTTGRAPRDDVSATMLTLKHKRFVVLVSARRERAKRRRAHGDRANPDRRRAMRDGSLERGAKVSKPTLANLRTNVHR